MHRRPVAAVVALFAARRRDRGPGRLGKEVDRGGESDQLDRSVEAPADTQAERLAIEACPFLEVLDIDVHERAHRVTFTGGPLRMVCSTTQ